MVRRCARKRSFPAVTLTSLRQVGMGASDRGCGRVWADPLDQRSMAPNSWPMLRRWRPWTRPDVCASAAAGRSIASSRNWKHGSMCRTSLCAKILSRWDTGKGSGGGWAVGMAQANVVGLRSLLRRLPWARWQRPPGLLGRIALHAPGGLAARHRAPKKKRDDVLSVQGHAVQVSTSDKRCLV